MSFGPVTFLSPLVLLGLLALPLIWWLLKVTPPAPRRQLFPPLRLFADMELEEETPDSTPVWLLLLRMLLVALLVIGLAQPVLQRADTSARDDLTLVIDTSWAGAAVWGDIVDEANALLADARRDNREVRLFSTTGLVLDAAPAPAQAALDMLERLQPEPFAPRFPDLSPAETAGTIYLSGGLGGASGNGVPDGVEVFAPLPTRRALVVGVPEEMAEGFRVPLFRAGERGLMSVDVRARNSGGTVIAATEAVFRDGTSRAEALFDLPAELRNRVARLEVAGLRSAASVRLLDDSWGRPVIGVMNVGQDTGSPLLSEPFYARTALAPHADIYEGGLDDLLPLSPSVIVMPDAARTTDPRLRAWLEAGGLLVRFAGDKLAERPDDLVPVPLRVGGRALGGALTWEDPQSLAPFSASSPFSGLDVPEDVRVTRQVMAEPGAETDARTWARLSDGAPVVTTDAVGEGRVVLFHVTSGPEWSNLAVSGLYVDMLKRLLPYAKAPTQAANPNATSADFAPERVMDGFGQLDAPGLAVRPLLADMREATPQTPPGLYRQGMRRRALNAVAEPAPPEALRADATYGRTRDVRLAGALLGAAALLLALDVLWSLLATGRRPRLPRRAIAASVLVLALIPTLPEARAQTDAPPPAALELHLAYVETGDARLDNLSESAMRGVAEALRTRTTIHPSGVVGVVPGQDVLDFYPFLYFPVRRDSAALEPAATDALNAYMAAGGTVILDTADFADAGLAVDTHPGLARVTEDLDIPPIAPVPSDHVLTKSFYLMQAFPGRYAGGDVWVEADQSGQARDGVSGVIIGSNDWASAWAIDDGGSPLIAVDNAVPRQREMAVRFAVNVGMYALAGNYKGDQVHTARLVERLGERATVFGLPAAPDVAPDAVPGPAPAPVEPRGGR